MRKCLFYIITLILLASIILVLPGCGSIVSMEGVQLEQVEKASKEVPEEEKDIKNTPSGALSIGSYILFGQYQVEDEGLSPILWKIIENKSHYRGNTSPDVKHMTLLTDYLIDQRGYDAKEPESDLEFRATYGNNRYSYSNIRQWLNTDKKGDSWWQALHDTDSPPVNEGFETGKDTGYYDKDGFLNSFNSKELDMILDTTLECGININADGGGTETVTDKVFLLSTTEVGISEEEGKYYFEGNPFAIFDSFESRLAMVSPQCYENTNSPQIPTTAENSWEWWLRSPYSFGEYDVWIVDYQGKAIHRRAYIDSNGLRLAINIKYEGVNFSGEGTADNPYVIK